MTFVDKYIKNSRDYSDCKEPFIFSDVYYGEIKNMKWFYLYEKKSFEKLAKTGRQIGFNSKMFIMVISHELNKEIEYEEHDHLS